jgi:hypothetical protein
METKHTLSDVLKRLVVDIDNMNSFLYSLENILESKSENVDVTQTKADGTLTTINVPSFGYLKGKIEDINSRFDTLLSTNSDVIGIKSSTGEVRKFELKKTSQVLADLENVASAQITLPTEFKVKNNWFFESFLNPLLYVGLDLSGVLTDDIDRFSVKRVIINAVNNDDFAAFFDTNYKGRNNVSLTSLRNDLNDNGIDFFEDDNLVEVDTAVNRYKGSFDVLRILEETGVQTLNNNQTASVVRNRYKLNSLSYTDSLSGIQNSKILAEGDVLITANDSEYKVLSVNKTDTEVVLERTFGIDPITIGASILRIKPQPYRFPELQVNVGFNEREVIFIRPVSKSANLTIDEYSNGIAIYTNELTIPLQDSSTSSLESYYNNFVSDFGLILLNLAKERKLPAIIGSKPNAPTIDAANFKVVQIDQHIQDDQNITKITSTIKEKAQVEKEIDELNKKIDVTKAQITTSAKTPQESKRLEKVLKETYSTRDEKVTTLSTLVTNATLQINTTPQFVTNKKYAIRGFWQIPTAQTTVYGNQQVAQFKYRYRYLSKSGNQPNATQQTFLDTDGTTKSATFSPWIEQLAKARTKELDTTTGLYIWSEEKVNDVDAVNSNQLEISIRKGEIVEIQIKSLSEAGWPDNPVESDWSTSVQVAFPEEISSQEEGTVISQKLFADKTKLDFEKTLISKGIDTHTASQFTTGDRFFAHKTTDIASGFFTTEGNVIDLYEQLTTLKTTLEAVQQAIANDTGVIKISIIDPDGNITDVANGDTISLFAGYYKDLIKDTTGGTVIYNEGKVVTKQYALSIQNTSASLLELISYFSANIGTGILAEANDGIPSDPNGYPDSDYHVNRRYDIVPLGVNNNTTPFVNAFKQIASEQSGQVKSQFVYARVRNYGLSEEIYAPQYPTNITLGYGQYYLSSYQYSGTTVGTATVPVNWGHYLPYMPLDPSGPIPNANSKVWNGTTDSSSNGVGGGSLTEFCISKDHPSLKTLFGASFSWGIPAISSKFRPAFATTSSTEPQKVLPFSHAIHFETSVAEGTNAFGIEYYKQAARITPITPTATAGEEKNYPIKLGFTPNDEYLIGKYTCGAYFYMFPLNYDAISVQGNIPSRAAKGVKLGSENALNIPILFQFRCSDKLGYIGGFRTNGTLNNIKYQKKIGLDIIVKNDVPFSFDLEVSAQYLKETSLDAPLVQGKGTIKTF